MTDELDRRPHIVLGYHGCDRRVGEDILAGEEMVAANNGYDWLGTGLYFWEQDPVRAMNWALEARSRHASDKRVSDKSVRDPYVVGAVINVGRCLDLTTLTGVSLVKAGFNQLRKDYKEGSLTLPKNMGGREMKGRYLDFAVINYTCSEYRRTKTNSFHTVRALFVEGKPLYAKAGFREKTHVQICVRRQDAIMGFFRIEQPTTSSR